MRPQTISIKANRRTCFWLPHLVLTKKLDLVVGEQGHLRSSGSELREAPPVESLDTFLLHRGWKCAVGLKSKGSAVPLASF